MSESTAITVREVNAISPRQVIEQATEEADVLAAVIEKQHLYSNIQGKKFVKVEGWTTLATLRGCLPREVSVTEMDFGRYVAEVELVRMSDGMVLTKASAECGGEEDPVWAKRPPNARRSMAITRATGKACRVAFSWVMALSGFEVTPAEEMDFVEAQPAPRQSENAALRQSIITPKGVDLGPPQNVRGADYILDFGKNKGRSIRDIDSGYLHWWIEALEKDIKDPAKANYVVHNQLQLTNAVWEKERREQEQPSADEPPHSVADADGLPF